MKNWLKRIISGALVIATVAYVGLTGYVPTAEATTTNLTQIIMGESFRPDGSPCYKSLQGFNDVVSSQSGFKNRTTISNPGTLYSFRMTITVAPGVGKTRTWIIRQNGADTSMTISISGASETTGIDNTHSLEVSAGDTFQIKETFTTSTANAYESWSFLFDNDTSQSYSNIMGQGLINGASYCALQNSSGTRSAANTYSSVAPCSGTLMNWYIYGYINSDVDTNPTITLYKNGSATALTLTTSTSNTYYHIGNDTTHTVDIAAGDLLSIYCTSLGGYVMYFASAFTFDSDVPQQTFVTGVCATSPSTSAVNYYPLLPGSASAWNASALFCEGIQDPSYAGAKLSNLYITITTASGAGKSYNYAILRTAGTIPTGLNVDLANTTSGSDTVHSWTLTGGGVDNLILAATPTGTPTAPTVTRWGFTITIDKVPLVTTMDATTVKDTYATLNAEITLLITAPCTERGFLYDTVSHPSYTDYAYSINETGEFEVETYSLTPTTLVKNTTYYFRGYATDGAGTGYSTIELSFTTLNPQGTSTALGLSIIGAVATSENYSTGISMYSVMNVGECDIDVLVQGFDTSGTGTNWELSDTGESGADVYAIYAGISDYDVIVKKTTPFNAVIEDLAPGDTATFGIRVISPSSITDQVNVKTAEVDVLYVAH